MSRYDRSISLKLLACLAILAVAGGCTTIQKGAAMGGVLGAGIGVAYGGMAAPAVTAGEGTIIGAVAGSVVGALVGADMAIKDQGDNAREIENLKNMLGAKNNCRQEMQKQIDALKRRLKSLEDGAANTQKRMKELSKIEDELKKVREVVAAVEEFKKTPRGLEMTILGETLFQPGLSELSKTGRQALDGIATIVKQKFPGKEIAIEGHTDNQSIKHSNWRSNWELGAARSQEVLHYFADAHKMTPSLLSAATFGEYRPVADNATADGKRLNRRAVIVILSQAADARGNQATQ